MPRSKQPLTPPLGFFVSFFSSAAAAGGFWFFFASRATRFNNVDLITKSFCRSFCKACTSSALTTMPIALLASIKNFHQRFGGIASQIGFLDIFVRVAFYLCGEKLGAKPFFGLPVEASTASFMLWSGTLLAGSKTEKSEAFELPGVTSNICMTSFRPSCSEIQYILTENFDLEAQSSVPCTLRGEHAGVIFKDGFHGFGRGSVKQNNSGHLFTESCLNADDLLSRNQNANACMSVWKAERNQMTCAAFHFL